MGESKHTPLSDAEVAEAYEEEMKGPQGVSFTLRDDHLLARAHRALMLEALQGDPLDSDTFAGTLEAAANMLAAARCSPAMISRLRSKAVQIRAAIKAATGGEP